MGEETGSRGGDTPAATTTHTQHVGGAERGVGGRWRRRRRGHQNGKMTTHQGRESCHFAESTTVQPRSDSPGTLCRGRRRRGGSRRRRRGGRIRRGVRGTPGGEGEVRRRRRGGPRRRRRRGGVLGGQYGGGEVSRQSPLRADEFGGPARPFGGSVATTHANPAGKRHSRTREPLRTETEDNRARRVCKKGDQKVNRSIKPSINFDGNLIGWLSTTEVWAIDLVRMSPTRP